MSIWPESEKKDNNTNTFFLSIWSNDLKGETKTTQEDERHSSNSVIVRMVYVCVNLYQSNYCCSQQVLQCTSIILYCLWKYVFITFLFLDHDNRKRWQKRARLYANSNWNQDRHCKIKWMTFIIYPYHLISVHQEWLISITISNGEDWFPVTWCQFLIVFVYI